MQKKIIPIIVFVFFLLSVTLACGISLDSGGEKEGDNSEELHLQLTRQSLQMTQAAMSSSQIQGQASSSGSSGGQTNQQSASSSSSGGEKGEEDETPCNDSHILRETIKDGTVFEPGEAFEKTWTLENVGDCDWTTAYTFKFIEGSRMGGSSSMNLPSVIEPGEEITFKVNLTAPDDPGTYTGVWQLFADDGEELGRYWVQIVVEDEEPPPPAFAVTGVTLSGMLFPNDITCPYNLLLSADITTNGAGTVTYKWKDSISGTYGPIQALEFAAAGTKKVDYNVVVFAGGNYTAEIYIDTPNHQTFGPFEFTPICAP